MRIFMLVQHSGIAGPLPKLTPLLLDSLRAGGAEIVTHGWGRESEGERVPAKLARRFRDVVSARRAARGGRFDVVVVQTAHDWRTLARDVPLALALRRRGRPIVLQLHGSRSADLATSGRRAFKTATRLLLSLVQGLLVLSVEEQRQWQAFSPRTAVLVVKNPYVRSLRPAAERPAGDPRLLFAGRLLEGKGVLDLVEAFSRVVERSACHLVFAGEGEDRERLQQRIRELGLDDCVTLAGYMTGADLARAYAEATIFVFPTSWDEGFPTVLAEAMDAELPIVTTPIRGAADHLVDGEHALFVEPGDVDALAEAVVSLLEDPERRRRMGRANVERLERFEPSAVGAEYLHALETLIGDA